MRYGHRVKHLRLDAKLKDEQAVLSKDMKEARERYDQIYGSLEEIRTQLLDSLSKTQAPPRSNPPMTKLRRLGKPDKKSSPFPQSDVKFISKVYGIPATHEKAWRALVDPLTSFIQLFTSIYRKASETTTKTIFDTTVKNFYRFETEAGTGTEHPPSPAEAVPDREQDPDVAGSTSGWYWLIEDLINCIYVHVMMVRDIASRGNYRLRLIEARLMHLDLICKRALWVGLGPIPTTHNAFVAQNQALKQLQRQEEKEQIDVRRDCIRMKKTQHLLLASQLREKMSKMIKIANGDTLAEPMDWEAEGTSLLWPNRQESNGSKYRIQCTNGHSFVIDQLKEPLQNWQCIECLAGPCDSSPSIPLA
ncbi:hypothetical protein BGX34_010977 [Mortierella sp. NVP85]|nr:hypothetical protein BGX34_010977 [Mortierella sp. NVP85]